MTSRFSLAALGMCLCGLLLAGCRSDQRGYRSATRLTGVFSRPDATTAPRHSSPTAPEVTPGDFYPPSEKIDAPAVEDEGNRPPVPPSAERIDTESDDQPAERETEKAADSIPLPTSNTLRRRSGLRDLIDGWRDRRSDEPTESEIPFDQPVARAGDVGESTGPVTTRVVAYEIRPLVTLGLPEFDDEPEEQPAAADAAATTPPAIPSGFGHSVTNATPQRD